MFEDELKLYRGRDIKIKDKIVVIQPTLSQIEEFGEREDFLVYNEDVEFMKKILNFLVYAYNEGMNTGKYEALMFNM